jgi:hypothetical protein
MCQEKCALDTVSLQLKRCKAGRRFKLETFSLARVWAPVLRSRPPLSHRSRRSLLL